MTFARFLVVAACLAALGVAVPSAVRAQSLRVMSFNVRLPSPEDGANLWEHRRDLMVETIRQQHPDVIGTQELYDEQGDYIVDKLPDYAWFGVGRRGGDGDEHMGVFYRRDRWRVKDSGNFWLSATPDKPGSITWGHPFPRMVTWALFEEKSSGRTFYMYNTHFPYRDGDEPAREHCADVILSRMAALPGDVPFVLTGDFNTTPDSRTHAALTRTLEDARTTAARHEGPDRTFHDFTGTPDRRIDWILYRGLQATDVRTVTTGRDGRYPSDHFPIVTDFAWPPAG